MERVSVLDLCVCIMDDLCSFLRNMKTSCMSASAPNNHVFWKDVQSRGRSMSLISDTEAEKAGGTSDVSEADATKVSSIVRKPDTCADILGRQFIKK